MYKRILKTRRVLIKGMIVIVLLYYVTDSLKCLKEITKSIRGYVAYTHLENEMTNTFGHLSVYNGNPVEFEYRVINSRSSVWKLKYDNFIMPAPLFFSEKSRQLFFKNADNAEFIGSRSAEKLKGEIHLVRNGTYATKYDCGYKSNVSHVLLKRSVGKADWFHKIIPMYTPEAWTFQHFLDGALPKIIQVLHILKDPNVFLLFERYPRDKIIFEILDELDISRDQIKFVPMEQIGADYLYFTCIAPPIHPVLWQSARRHLGVTETMNVKLLKDAFVVFITRKGCTNCGRVVRNEKDIISMLETRYGKDIVKVFKGAMNLADVKTLFGNSRVVMGSIGGGMYNINFAPINTTVIEFVPTHSDGTIEAASKNIIWSQAVLLGQIFWRVCSIPIPDSGGDMIIDLEELTGILDVADKRLQLAISMQ